MLSLLIYTGGKSSISETGNPGVFNREASALYKQLSPEEKEALKQRAASQLGKRLSRKDILKEAEKIFAKVQKLVSLGPKK